MVTLDCSFESLPCAQACRRIDFDFVEIRGATRPGDARLVVVSGIKQWADLRVTLEPLRVGGTSEFRSIEVVGRLAHGLPALVDFCVVLPLDALDGSKGVEIVGATRSQRLLLEASGERDRGG
jgi:hypothetical protein